MLRQELERQRQESKEQLNALHNLLAHHFTYLLFWDYLTESFCLGISSDLGLPYLTGTRLTDQ